MIPKWYSAPPEAYLIIRCHEQCTAS
jgi:hypothetical protein